MRQGKVALRGKPDRNFVAEQKQRDFPENQHISIEMNGDGLNLILDNSSIKYANDAFFVNNAKKIDEKFIQTKSIFLNKLRTIIVIVLRFLWHDIT